MEIRSNVIITDRTGARNASIAGPANISGPSYGINGERRPGIVIVNMSVRKEPRDPHNSIFFPFAFENPAVKNPEYKHVTPR